MPQSFTAKLRENNQPFFGYAKEGQLPPVTLLVRHRNGNQQAFHYQYLTTSMDYNPSEGIKLQFCDPVGVTVIKIEGRNLQTLWDHLTRHRVTFIEPAATVPDETPEDELCVTEVRVQEV